VRKPKISLVTPGKINDGGWSQNAYKGLKLIETELHAEVYNAEGRSASEAMTAFKAFAAEGNQIIFGHASEWFEPVQEIARNNPNTTFIITGSEKEAIKNVAGMRFVLEDASYALGYLAGRLSKSGVLACVGPMKHPVIESTFYSFELGAKAARADIQVRIVWTDSWTDVAKAKEKTLALISEKADFIFHNCNDGAPGVFEAVQQNKDKGVLAFGSNDDQNALFPEVILASAVLDIPKVFLQTAKRVQEGQFDGKTQVFGMPEGCVWITFNDKLKDRIPEELKKKTDELIEQIKKGEFKVERRVLK
jgi:basic membrane lipoprotein Med (substrate-binding protein (PBP1-ABC) superfamily)